ncbi:hypothetical protein JTB14_034775 [Gonioctena quinquepunctata]|nr:hypothetical protein JTB14_034775 [Gonioctena quinquepunctata]
MEPALGERRKPPDEEREPSEKHNIPRNKLEVPTAGRGRARSATSYLRDIQEGTSPSPGSPGKSVFTRRQLQTSSRNKSVQNPRGSDNVVAKFIDKVPKGKTDVGNLESNNSDDAQESPTGRMPRAQGDSLEVQAEKAGIECGILSNSNFEIPQENILDFSLESDRSRRPRVPVVNIVTWTCAVYRTMQER